MNILCKVFGHKVASDSLNVKRLFAHCKRCYKALKVSYDMSTGDTIVTGDYGKQTTFIWCDCGNELCSSGSYHHYQITEKGSHEVYYCSNCGEKSCWVFDAPAPFKVEPHEL